MNGQRPESIEPDWLRFLEQPRELRSALAGADPGVLGRLIPGGGGWSIRDHIVHLVDGEMMFGVRIRMAIAEDTPTLPALEPELWKRRLQHLWREPEAAISLVEQLRWGNAELLERLDAQGWERTGTLSGEPITIAALLHERVTRVNEQITAIEESRTN